MYSQAQEAIISKSYWGINDVRIYPNGYPDGKKIENPVNIKLIKEFRIMGQTHFIGKAGQLSVMSEIALRGFNVAMPEIDTGDDIFAVNDMSGAMWRLQVKTSIATKQKKSFRSQFSVPSDQIKHPLTPELHYVFVTRIDERWEYVVISREVLNHLVSSDNLGSVATRKNGKDYVQIYLVFDESGNVTLSKKDITRYKNNWETWSSILKD